MQLNLDKLDLLDNISKKQQISQMKFADEAGFSFSNIDYSINALKKGYIIIKDFKNNKNKAKYIYMSIVNSIKKNILTINSNEGKIEGV